jgi:hypothetical protein
MDGAPEGQGEGKIGRRHPAATMGDLVRREVRMKRAPSESPGPPTAVPSDAAARLKYRGSARAAPITGVPSPR